MIITIGRICLYHLLQGDGERREGFTGGNDHIYPQLGAGLICFAVAKLFPKGQIAHQETSGYAGIGLTAEKLTGDDGFSTAFIDCGDPENRQGIVGGDGGCFQRIQGITGAVIGGQSRLFIGLCAGKFRSGHRDIMIFQKLIKGEVEAGTAAVVDHITVNDLIVEAVAVTTPLILDVDVALFQVHCAIRIVFHMGRIQYHERVVVGVGD